MTRVLLVTVGGSPEPILQACRAHQPDEVIFICSAPPCRAPSLGQVLGDGTPCLHVDGDGRQEHRPNLVRQLELQDFQPALQIVALPDPDDLAAIHRQLHSFCRSLAERFSRLEIIGDYSGGTKSMSAALAMVLVEQGAALSLVAGERTNLVRIERSAGTRPVGIAVLQLQRLLQDQLPLLLADHFYDRAGQLLRQWRVLHQESLDAGSLEAISELETSLSVLMLWDRFCWEAALDHSWECQLSRQHPELIAWWKRVVAARQWLEQDDPQAGVTGYELVQDLLLNAERRGRRGWFDDAVARLYRALELLAQTYIQLEKGYNHRSFWDDEQIRRDCNDWSIRRGVNGLYWWLRQTEGAEGLGALAARQWIQLRELLNARNDSLLGHGLLPVRQADWQSLQQRVTNLVTSALQEAGCQQGPLPCQLPGPALLDLPAAQHFLSVQP
jgi:CRISPR-associated protein (TIGR02710 family)